MFIEYTLFYWEILNNMEVKWVAAAVLCWLYSWTQINYWNELLSSLILLSGHLHQTSLSDVFRWSASAKTDPEYSDESHSASFFLSPWQRMQRRRGSLLWLQIISGNWQETNKKLLRSRTVCVCVFKFTGNTSYTHTV